MSAKAVKLRNMLEVQNGFAFKTEFFHATDGLPLIRIRDLDGETTDTHYTGEFRDEFIVSAGDYLIGMDGNFHCRRWAGTKALLNQRVCRLRNFSPDVLPEYVFFGIQPKLNAIEASTSFATVKHISARQILDIELPLPPLTEQRHIVDILSRAEGIVRLRREAEKKAAELVPAMFLDMLRLGNSAKWKEYYFGDPSVMEIIDGDRGTNYPKKSDFSKSGYCLFLNTSNVRKGAFDFSKCEFVTQEKDDKLRKGKLVRGDVILTTRGTLGNSAHYHNQVPYENVRINSGMVVLRANLTLLMPEYLLAILNSGAFIKQVAVLNSGSAQPQLPINRLAHINFVLPPLHLQKELTLRASEVRSIQSQQSAANATAQATFDALLSKVFSK
jgi:type I restriction enzyme S subunit